MPPPIPYDCVKHIMSFLDRDSVCQFLRAYPNILPPSEFVALRQFHPRGFHVCYGCVKNIALAMCLIWDEHISKIDKDWSCFLDYEDSASIDSVVNSVNKRLKKISERLSNGSLDGCFLKTLVRILLDEGKLADLVDDKCAICHVGEVIKQYIYHPKIIHVHVMYTENIAKCFIKKLYNLGSEWYDDPSPCPYVCNICGDIDCESTRECASNCKWHFYTARFNEAIKPPCKHTKPKKRKKAVHCACGDCRNVKQSPATQCVMCWNCCRDVNCKYHAPIPKYKMPVFVKGNCDLSEAISWDSEDDTEASEDDTEASEDEDETSEDDNETSEDDSETSEDDNEASEDDYEASEDDYETSEDDTEASI